MDDEDTGPPVERATYLLVDGENIDATLGQNVFGGRRPRPDERPRWERVREFAESALHQPVKGLFFLNASSGQLPMGFVQALVALQYRPVPLSGAPGEKVVDLAIQRMLEALVDRPADVLLATHDGDFLPQVEALLGPGRRVGLLAFPEMVSQQYSALRAMGLEVFDLEHDAHSFTVPLPRLRIIPIEEFDPLQFL